MREITISKLELISYEPDRIIIDVECSTGTYIRSLAHEIGQELGCGGYLAELIRTRIGPVEVERASRLAELHGLAELGRLSERFVAVEDVLGFATVYVDPAFAEKVRFGQYPKGGDLATIDGTFDAGDALLVKDNSGKLLAIGRASMSSVELKRANGEAVLSYERVLA